MTAPIHQRITEVRQSGVPCAVASCFKLRHRFGSHCRAHEKTREGTGDPLGSTIRITAVRPWANLARDYIVRNANHDAIGAALDWTRDLMASGVAPRGRLPVRATAPRRLSAWLARIHDAGVEPVDVLALIVGMHLYQLAQPREFVSDDHFRHQLANRLIRLAPAPSIQPWSNGKPMRRKYDRVTSSVRALLADRIIEGLGSFPLRVALQLITDTELKPEPADRDKLATPLPISVGA